MSMVYWEIISLNLGSIVLGGIQLNVRVRHWVVYVQRARGKTPEKKSHS